MYRFLNIINIILTVLIITGCGKSISTDTVTDNIKGTTPNVEADKIITGNSVNESGVKDISSHSGVFDVSMSGYKGELFIGISEGRFYATIKFFNWGNGTPQPVTDLKITEDKIYFKRAIKTKEDLVKYGGTAYFDQDFYGIFTADKKTIKGYYRYIGTQDNWEAIKNNSGINRK